MMDPIREEAGLKVEPKEEDVYERTIRENAQQDYRLYNFLQLFDVTMFMLNNSRYPPMVEQSQKDIKEIFSTLVTLKDEDSSLRAHIDQCHQALSERIGKQEEVHKQFAKDHREAALRLDKRIESIEEGV